MNGLPFSVSKPNRKPSTVMIGYTYRQSEPDSGRWTAFLSDDELVAAYDKASSFAQHSANMQRLKRRAEQRRRDGIVPDHTDDLGMRFASTYAIRRAAYDLYRRVYGHDPEAERRLKRR